jgi:hypothetical protein
MSDFKQAFQKMIPGNMLVPGEEKKDLYRGILRQYYPRWAGWQLIDKEGIDTENQMAMLEPHVREFYKSNFWDQLGCDMIESQPISESLFALSINCGSIIANEFLQKAVDIINGNRCISKEYLFEYKIGDIILEELNHGIQKTYDEVLVNILNGYQISLYLKLFEMNPANRSYHNWFHNIKIAVPVNI